MRATYFGCQDLRSHLQRPRSPSRGPANEQGAGWDPRCIFGSETGSSASLKKWDSSADRELRNPITDIAGCCARHGRYRQSVTSDGLV